MKFSIIVPMYNVKGYVSGCVESILSQEFDDFELILVDDGSTDETVETVEHFLKQSEKEHLVKIIKKENAGASSARNEGISVAKGDYIVFMDADDCMIPNSLQVMDLATKKDDVDLYVFSLKKEIEGVLNESSLSLVENFVIREENGVRVLEKYLDKTNYIITWQPWSKVFKRDIINHNNIKFDTSLYCCNDFNFFMNYFIHVTSVSFNNTPVTVYNYGRPGSISWTKVEKRMKSSMKAYTDMFYTIKDTNIESCQLLSYMSYLYLCAVELASKLQASQTEDINASIDMNKEVYNYAKDKISVFKRFCYNTFGIRRGAKIIDISKKFTGAIRKVNSDI